MGLIFFVIGISAASPIAPGLMSWFILPKLNTQSVFAKFGVTWLITLSLSLVYASREVSRGGFDDFGNVYYYRYLEIQSNSSIGLSSKFAQDGNISKFEVLYDVLLYVIAQYPVKLGPNALILLTTLFIGTLYQVWCFKYFSKAFPDQIRSRVICCCLVLFSFGLCSQTARQMLSIPFLLMTIWEGRFLWKALFLILASASHSSAFLVYLVYRFFKQFPRVGFILGVSCAVIFSGSGMEIIQQYIESGGDDAVDKAQYYASGDAQQHAAINFKYVWIPIFLFLITTLRGKQVGADLKSLAAVGLIVYIILINVPLASYRATLFLTAALVGPIMVISNLQIKWLGLGNFWLPNLLSFVMVAKRAFSGHDGEPMALWYKYELIGVTPFYYLKNLFDGT